LLWWLRRPLLIPRYLALRAGREDALITRHDRIAAVGLLVAIIVLVAGGFYWAEAKYPNTIPLQAGRSEPLLVQALMVDVKVKQARYDVPRAGRADHAGGDQQLQQGHAAGRVHEREPALR